ncbi:hypothetical protein F4V57_06330 [Acinetobacter qingfengensis]|uniref:Zinc-ribbon domain-containing protein n=1 Tax=Acinetobacter qingfengensis TaxID=1262585 RepID=A0A1E7RE05_9GAMM|nr:putative zinc-binding metallopeptidase [Acinetobacter qingfengensis]KAA8733672.1 hypothetical protein F4V57_06330 [Acinetobacter qingfengensis]OEY97513.1 hypothetical protein BJI46_09805 [Acinetobacter qingfengensis]
MKIFYCSNCQAQIFFHNYICNNCQHPVGYVPALETMMTFKKTEKGWQSLDENGLYFKACKNYQDYHVCNWMIDIHENTDLCESCKLTTVIPDLHEEKNIEYWAKLETAKRRFLYMTQRLKIFPRAKKNPDDHLGLSFQFLVPTDDQPVLTGHANGLITLNAFEADTVYRETTRISMGENYRTLLGHFRHESGHFYFDTLVQNSKWIDEFRQLFGDERIDYADSLKHYYENGAQENWQENYISAYATSHPWEDWAESWAHYLHMISTLDTAFYTGMSIQSQHPNNPELKFKDCPVCSADFTLTIKNWFALSYSLNALNRSMGLSDAYPFTLSDKVINKLHFIHQILLENINKKSIDTMNGFTWKN